MFDQIIDLIKDSVTTVVGLTVGVLGLGDAALFNPSSGDALPAEDIKISEDLPAGEAGLPDNADIFETQLANILQALQGDGAGGGLPAEQAGETAAPIETADTFVSAENTRTSSESETSVEASVATTEPEIRPINPIKSAKQIKPVDISALLKEDFDKFDANLQITEIIEDTGGFYIDYQFLSYGIENKIWTKTLKEKKMLVSKTFLGEKDLSDYLSEELGEVIDNEIIFLKEVQEIQKAKQAKIEIAAQLPQAISSKYSALIGKVLDVNNEQFGDYVPIKKEEVAVSPNVNEAETIETNKTTHAGIIDNEAPVIIIQGNNPALIQIGASYLDLGAKTVDNISNNLGVQTGGDVVNTEVKGSYFVVYTATDEAGNVATATREVIVYDYGVAPEVKPVAEEPVKEIIAEEPIIEIIEKPVVEAEEPPAIAEEKTAEELIATTTEIAADETATTTTPVETAISVIETIAETTAKTIDTTTEAIGAVVGGAVEGGKKAGRKIGEKTKKAAEVVSETAEAVAETVSETTEAALEQMSEAVETVAGEVSAMIKKVHFMKLLGNIRSALQSSVITAEEGTGEVLKSVKQLLRPVAKNTHRIINSAANKTRDVLKNIWQKIGLNQAISRITDRAAANISGYKQDNNLQVGKENFEPDGSVGFEYPECQERNFIGFVFDKTIETSASALDKTINLASSLTAAVKDFGGTVGSDLKDVGAKIGQKIENTDFGSRGLIQKIGIAVQGTIAGALDFFKTHRPE